MLDICNICKTYAIYNTCKMKNIFLKPSKDETYFYRSATCLVLFYQNIYLHKLPHFGDGIHFLLEGPCVTDLRFITELL